MKIIKVQFTEHELGGLRLLVDAEIRRVKQAIGEGGDAYYIADLKKDLAEHEALSEKIISYLKIRKA